MVEVRVTFIPIAEIVVAAAITEVNFTCLTQQKDTEQLSFIVRKGLDIVFGTAIMTFDRHLFWLIGDLLVIGVGRSRG